MGHTRLPYDDAATTHDMARDCRAVERALHLPGRDASPAPRADHAALGPVPGVGPTPGAGPEDGPGERARPAVSAAAARLAAGLHLHLS